MAEKMDFNEFYEQTKPTKELIDYLHSNSKLWYHLATEDRIHVANLTFGMLAHLHITDNKTWPYLSSRLRQVGISDREYIDNSFDLLDNLTITHAINLNPTVIPTIQKYRELFDLYEKKNGIITPFNQETEDN